MEKQQTSNTDKLENMIYFLLTLFCNHTEETETDYSLNGHDSSSVSINQQIVGIPAFCKDTWTSNVINVIVVITGVATRFLDNQVKN